MVSQHTGLANWGFGPFIQAAQQEHLLYDIPVLESPADATIHLDKRELVNFAGINFLGLQQDEEIQAHFLAATRKYGMVTGGSRDPRRFCWDLSHGLWIHRHRLAPF